MKSKKRAKANQRLCDCCHKKKAVVRNPNGQWYCKSCDGIATMANKILGSALSLYG